MKFKNKMRKILNANYSTKEGANGSSTVIPKVQGVQKKFASYQYSLGDQRYKHLSALHWTSGLHWMSGLQKTVFSSFCLHPGHKNNMEEKIYPAMDSPVYGENIILVVRKL